MSTRALIRSTLASALAALMLCLAGCQGPAEKNNVVFLADMAIKVERGLPRIPADWLLRLSYKPFHSYLQTRVLHWLNTAGKVAG